MSHGCFCNFTNIVGFDGNQNYIGGENITRKKLSVKLILKNMICPLCPRVSRILKGRGAISPPSPLPASVPLLVSNQKFVSMKHELPSNKNHLA